MDLEATLEREQDIEELRRVALALHAQLQQTIRQLKRKCDQLAFYSGNKEALQQTLALIEKLTAQSKAAEKAAQAPSPKNALRVNQENGNLANARSRSCRKSARCLSFCPSSPQ